MYLHMSYLFLDMGASSSGMRWNPGRYTPIYYNAKSGVLTDNRSSQDHSSICIDIGSQLPAIRSVVSVSTKKEW